VKIVADKNSKAILGVHIVGNGASDLIAEGTLAVQHRINLMELSATIHAHPTLSEMIVEAAEAVFGKAIHTI
jgi:pyruvate/2-oxoglutarate dehydrogenase complex dihydrolipoamide dehydrogenase (E3) component